MLTKLVGSLVALVSGMKRLILTALLALSASCATTSTSSTTTLPPAVQAQWNACEEQINHHCHEHAYGDPAHESECRRDARRDFAQLTTDEARTRFLREHACNR